MPDANTHLHLWYSGRIEDECHYFWNIWADGKMVNRMIHLDKFRKEVEYSWVVKSVNFLEQKFPPPRYLQLLKSSNLLNGEAGSAK